MDTFFQQLKKMYDFELYENVLPIACIIKAAYDRDRSLLTPEQYFLTLVYNGHSLVQQQQYRQASVVYRDALLARKALTKPKRSSALSNNYEDLVEMYPEHEILYRRARCLEILKAFPEAISTLELIPTDIRTPKVNMMLGHLYQRSGRNNNAVTAFKLVLRETPMNLQVIKLLLMLGVLEVEIDVIIFTANLPSQCLEWLKSWIDTYITMYKCRFGEAANKLEALQSTSIFAKNEVFTVLLGQCYYYNGDTDNALKHLSRAYANNPFLLEGLTTLAAALASKKRLDELEKLTQMQIPTTEYASEHWSVLAQYLFAQGKYDKATQFAHKACCLNPKNIEACLLKAKAFHEEKKYKEAIVQLKVLQGIAAHRYEVYEALVFTHIETFRMREAQQIASKAVRTLGKTPRTYVLAAQPFLNDTLMRSKAKPLLEKALELNKNYTPAIFLLVELLQEEGDTAACMKLLKPLVTLQPSSNLFTILGLVCKAEKDTAKAIHYFTKAIHMDPDNRKACSELMALEQSLSSKDDSVSYTTSTTNETNEFQDNNFEVIEVQNLPSPRGALPNIEEEEGELWSDVEIELTNNE